jgi:acyl-CoA reductase-like NAD-dependent aldehyde dehydrogenase
MTDTLAPVKPARLIINGEAVDAASGKTFTTVNPATEEPICTVAEAGVEDVVDLREPVVTSAVAASPRRTRTRGGSSWRRWSATHAVEDFGDEIAVAHVDERDPGAELAASAYAPAGRSWVLPAPGAGWYPGTAPGLDG